MFSNPFNSKIVADITKFLSEHRNDIDIDPCLNEAAEKTAAQIGDEMILEDRRSLLRDRFNEAVSDCGCRGTTKEANAFTKAVEMHIEEGKGKKSLPPAFLKNIQKKKDAAKKKDGEDKKEEVEEESWGGENRPPFGGILEDLSSGESHGLRFEKTNNPRRGAKSQGNKSAEAQYCLAVRKDGSLIGWIIPMKGTDGSVIGYGWYHGDPFKQPNAPFFSGRAGGFGSLAHTLSALKDQIGKQFGTKTESLEEAAKKRKPYDEVYRKWFDRVPVDIMDITKAVEMHIEEGKGKKSLPPAFLKNIQKKKDAAKKEYHRKEEVEEGFAQPTEKELRASVKWLESILKDPKKLKDSGLTREDAEDNLAAAKDMLSFGKAHGSKIKP